MVGRIHLPTHLIQCLLLSFWLIGNSIYSQAQSPQLKIHSESSNISLQYQLTDSQAGFFVLKSDTPQNLRQSRTLFYAGQGAGTNKGSISIPLLGDRAGFYGLFEFPLAAGDVVEMPISDESAMEVDSLYFDTQGLPSSLTVGASIQIIINVNNDQRVVQLVQGDVVFTLLDAAGVSPSFPFTINPASLPVKNGIAAGSITIQAETELNGYFLAAEFLPSSSARSLSKSNIFLNQSKKSKQLSDETFKQLAEYEDPDRINWGYPLTKQFSLSGVFGEWPGHSDIHWGIDISAKSGEPVVAAKKGVVTKIGFLSEANTNLQFVTIDHGQGTATRYLHIRPGVKLEQIVNKGDLIGTVAETIWTGYKEHLHFELMMQAKPVGANYNYSRGKTYPFPLVNPISRDLLFTPSLTNNDSKPPEFKGVIITKMNPAVQEYKLNGSRNFSANESDISEAYLLVQLVDDENSNYLTPMVISFDSELNISQSINFQSSQEEIKSFHKKAGKPGYALLPKSEELSVRNFRYKFWFPWNTEVYRYNPKGQRFVSLEMVDVAGRGCRLALDYGPEILSVVPKIVNNRHVVSVALRSHLGATNGSLFFQPDRYKFTIVKADSISFDQNLAQWDKPVANNVTPIRAKHLQEIDYTFSLPATEDLSKIRLRVTSQLLTNIIHEVPLCAGDPLAGNYSGKYEGVVDVGMTVYPGGAIKVTTTGESGAPVVLYGSLNQKTLTFSAKGCFLDQDGDQKYITLVTAKGTARLEGGIWIIVGTYSDGETDGNWSVRKQNANTQGCPDYRYVGRYSGSAPGGGSGSFTVDQFGYVTGVAGDAEEGFREFLGIVDLSTGKFQALTCFESTNNIGVKILNFSNATGSLFSNVEGMVAEGFYQTALESGSWRAIKQ